MHDRIKELVDKSGLYIAYDNREVTDKELEFFAELIVRECVEQIIIRKRADGEWYQDDIFKHFGVEE